MSVHDLLTDVVKRNYYLSDDLNWVLFIATTTKGRCKWSSYNSNVFVEGFCSSWSRHYVCIKSALLHSYYSHNVISVLIEDFFFANLNNYSYLGDCIVPNKHESMDQFEQFKYFEEETHIVEIPVTADSHGHRSANMPHSFQVQSTYMR